MLPQLLSNNRQGIGKGRQRLGVPRRLTDRKPAVLAVVSQQGHQRKQSQQGRRGAGNGQIRPLALRLDPQMGPHFVERDLQLPAHDEPLQDLHRIGGQIGAQQGLRLELTFRITDQHPADGQGRPPV